MTEIGSRQWNDSAEMSEWAFMAMVMREAKDLLPMNFSPLGVAIDIADARANSGWRTVPDDDFAPDQTAEIIRLRDALFSATASLAGAASAYRNYAKRHKLHGTAETDAVFSTRVNDFDKAVNSARAALAAKP